MPEGILLVGSFWLSSGHSGGGGVNNFTENFRGISENHSLFQVLGFSDKVAVFSLGHTFKVIFSVGTNRGDDLNFIIEIL